MVENQQLSTFVNLASFEKLKEKVGSTQSTMDVEMPQSVGNSGLIYAMEAFSRGILSSSHRIQ